MQGRHQTIWTHDDRSFRELITALTDALEIVSGRIGLTDGSRGEVHDLVAVVANK
jgi:hypothetical protein